MLEKNLISKRITGALLCVGAAILYAARSVAGAVYHAYWGSSYTYQQGLFYAGKAIWFLFALFLIGGIVYLIWAEVESWREKHPTLPTKDDLL